jgi:hypothetical protein
MQYFLSICNYIIATNRNVYKDAILLKSMAKKSLISVLAIGAGLALAGNATAQTAKPNATFDYASHRNVPAIDGRCYEGVIFNYTLLLDGKIAQTDKPNVHILSRWFYDIDNDGKFGKAEEDAIKKGIPIYMHEEFNKAANAKVAEFLNAAEEYKKLYQSLSETTISKDEVAKYQARIDALEEKLRESGKACGLEEKALCAKPLAQEVNPAKTSDFKPYWSLTAGADSNFEDTVGFNAGARFYPAENLGFGVSADVGFGKDKMLKSYEDILIDNLRAVGTAVGTHNLSVGLSGEVQIGPVLFGAGADYDSRIVKKSVELLEGDEVIKSNSDSIFETGFSGKVYGGVEIPISKKFGVGVIGGYKFGKSDSGAFGGVKLNFKLRK